MKSEMLVGGQEKVGGGEIADTKGKKGRDSRDFRRETETD